MWFGTGGAKEEREFEKSSTLGFEEKECFSVKDLPSDWQRCHSVGEFVGLVR